VSFPGGNCSAIVPQSPFEQGFSDENFPYDRGRDRYRAKNARLDSLDELYMVAGIGDAFMAAFGDQVTVYLPREEKISVNQADSKGQMRIAEVIADAATLPLLADPAFPEKLHRALLMHPARMGGITSITQLQFEQTLQALGVTVRADRLSTNPKNPFTDRSVTFRIRGVGAAGDVTKTIDAVVTYDPTQLRDPVASQAQALLQAGRLIHWRQE
jgi:general secretion pathway protein K